MNLAYDHKDFLAVILGLNFKTGDEAKKLISDLNHKKNAFCEFKYGSKNYVLNYKTVGINKWYLFSIVEKNILNIQARNILLETKKLLFMLVLYLN